MGIVKVEQVSNALRIKSKDYKGEIESLISSCILDLKDSGIIVEKDERISLINTAIILYCKSLFGLDNPNSELYMKMYKDIVISLKNGREADE